MLINTLNTFKDGKIKKQFTQTNLMGKIKLEYLTTIVHDLLDDSDCNPIDYII
jgi:hypothetical protein